MGFASFIEWFLGAAGHLVGDRKELFVVDDTFRFRDFLLSKHLPIKSKVYFHIILAFPNRGRYMPRNSWLKEKKNGVTYAGNTKRGLSDANLIGTGERELPPRNFGRRRCFRSKLEQCRRYFMFTRNCGKVSKAVACSGPSITGKKKFITREKKNHEDTGGAGGNSPGRESFGKNTKTSWGEFKRKKFLVKGRMGKKPFYWKQLLITVEGSTRPVTTAKRIGVGEKCFPVSLRVHLQNYSWNLPSFRVFMGKISLMCGAGKGEWHVSVMFEKKILFGPDVGKIPVPGLG